MFSLGGAAAREGLKGRVSGGVGGVWGRSGVPANWPRRPQLLPMFASPGSPFCGRLQAGPARLGELRKQSGSEAESRTEEGTPLLPPTRSPPGYSAPRALGTLLSSRRCPAPCTLPCLQPRPAHPARLERRILLHQSARIVPPFTSIKAGVYSPAVFAAFGVHSLPMIIVWAEVFVVLFSSPSANISL